MKRTCIQNLIASFLIRKKPAFNNNPGKHNAASNKNWDIQKIEDALGYQNYYISNLEGRIRSLEKKYDEIKLQIDTPFEIVPRTNEESLPWPEIKEPEIKKPAETFFLSTPNSDGSFNESSASVNFKEGASIYRFTKNGNSRAHFQIDERDASVKLALQYPDKNIDPVCDAVNAFNPKAKRIVTVGAGEAELVNDKWIVNKFQKAKIRYEN